MQDVKVEIIYAKVEGINTSDSMYNIGGILSTKEKINLKIEIDRLDNVNQGYIYEFKAAKKLNSERNSYYILEYRSICEVESREVRNNVLRSFMKYSPVEYLELKDKIESYLNKIENKVIYQITSSMLKKFEDDFYLYPAAARLHHAYVGGLAYHTLGMLDLCDNFIKSYDFLDKDYLYALIILHDMAKVNEFTGIENTQYALKGQLLGHLVMCSNEITLVAKECGVEDSKEVLLLTHGIISHHGQLAFGSPKRPATAEAILVWYLDSIDSKFRALGEELEKTDVDSFTDSIGVLERTKVYKHK